MKKNTKKLALKRSTVRVLNRADLTAANGGADGRPCGLSPSCTRTITLDMCPTYGCQD